MDARVVYCRCYVCFLEGQAYPTSGISESNLNVEEPCAKTQEIFASGTGLSVWMHGSETRGSGCAYPKGPNTQ